MSEDTDLPKALIKRLIKAKLAELEAADAAPDRKSLQLNKEALLALSESTKVFIQYVTATASAICKAAQRQTLSEEDVYAALNDIQFGDMVGPLREHAKAFKQKDKRKITSPVAV